MVPMFRVDAVVFDHGGVLTTPIDPALASSASEAGLSVATVLDSFREPTVSEAMRQLETGAIGVDEFRTIAHASAPHVIDLFDPRRKLFFGHRLQPLPAAEELLRRLYARRIKTAVCSNSPREWMAVLEHTIPARSLFESEVWSWRIGRRKPDEVVFRRVLTDLGTSASETLFLDDSKSTIEAAASYGFQTLHVIDPLEALNEVNRNLG